MRLLLLPLLFLTTAAFAQTTRTVQDARLWPELQSELALKNGDYLLLTLRGERVLADENQSLRHLGFDAGQVRVAYEHFWNARWSWGAAARFNGGSGQLQVGSLSGETLTPELLVRHRSPILGGLTFGQRLSAERLFPFTQGYKGGPGPGGQNWGRLRVDLEKSFLLGSGLATGLALRPRLSYEASTHLRFQKAAANADERTIQFTSLRGEVGVRVSPVIDFTPWFAYQTKYDIELAKYDRNNVQTDPEHNINLVYPTVGLDVRFTILPAGTRVDRQQLPTQH